MRGACYYKKGVHTTRDRVSTLKSRKSKLIFVRMQDKVGHKGLLLAKLIIIPPALPLVIPLKLFKYIQKKTHRNNSKKR